MPGRPRNITGRSKGMTLSGVKELTEKFNGLANAMAGLEAQELVGKLAKNTADHVRANARTQRWPKLAQDSIFSFDKLPAGRRSKVTALVGINKQRSMVEWTAARNPKSPKAKVVYPGKVAMSLATMMEFGTTRGPAKPAFRPAVINAKAELPLILAKGLKEIIARHGGN